MRTEDDLGFTDFVSAEQAALVRLAVLLTGDRGTAEDLVQTALMKCYRHRSRITRSGTPSAYVRRVMVTTHTGWRRRLSATEQVVETLPERPDPSAEHQDDDEELRRALRAPLHVAGHRVRPPAPATSPGAWRRRRHRSGRRPVGPHGRVRSLRPLVHRPVGRRPRDAGRRVGAAHGARGRAAVGDVLRHRRARLRDGERRRLRDVRLAGPAREPESRPAVLRRGLHAWACHRRRTDEQPRRRRTPGTATAEALHVDGRVLAQYALTDGVAIVPPPAELDAVRFRDAAGAVVGKSPPLGVPDLGD